MKIWILLDQIVCVSYQLLRCREEFVSSFLNKFFWDMFNSKLKFVSSSDHKYQSCLIKPYCPSSDLSNFHDERKGEKSGFGDKSGDMWQIGSVKDFMWTIFSVIGSNLWKHKCWKLKKMSKNREILCKIYQKVEINRGVTNRRMHCI